MYIEYTSGLVTTEMGYRQLPCKPSAQHSYPITSKSCVIH